MKEQTDELVAEPETTVSANTREVDGEYRTLPVGMTPEEKITRVNELAEVAGKIESLESSASGIKGSIKSLKERASEIFREIRRGTIDKQVECLTVYNYTEKTKTVIRKDTGENLGQWPMTDADCQTSLLDEKKEAYESDGHQADFFEHPYDGFGDEQEGEDQ